MLQIDTHAVQPEEDLAKVLELQELQVETGDESGLLLWSSWSGGNCN